MRPPHAFEWGGGGGGPTPQLKILDPPLLICKCRGGVGCLGVCIVGLDDGAGMWEGMLSVLVRPTGEMVRGSCG